MSQFHKLTVTGIKKTIRDAVVVTLQTDAPDAFKFVQGQYLTFRREFHGEELRRSYSICAACNDNVLQVGIKQVDGGAFSTWANTDLRVGDQLEAMPPMGNFFRKTATPVHRHILCIAAGSGITPILSILKTGLKTDTEREFTLIYANRSINSIMFREELEDLKNNFMERLSIFHILSDGSQDIELFTGRLDTEKCEKLFNSCVNPQSIATVYICGPEAMMINIAHILKVKGFDEQNIRFELFKSAQPGLAKQRALTTNNSIANVSARTTVGGETRSFSMTKDISLLEAAITNNLDAPFACKAGVCSTCRAKVLHGEVEMIANHALEDYEVEAGFVLTCQCYPVSDDIAWDYDQAGH
ncbi:MAG: 2Fe-2S iron-sulfur cluster-binding protein [Granulosicoccus sp.]